LTAQLTWTHFTEVMSLVLLEGIFSMRFERITVNPAVATGKPCIRNLRFPVSRLLGLVAAGETRESILGAYPYLEAADIDEALRYAASLSEDETIELRSGSALEPS
jgi:uncharacterized protein (DUF433 family)